MARGHKRYYVRYESDKIVCGSNDHHYSNFNKKDVAIFAARQILQSGDFADENPRNVRVYDTCTPEGDSAKIVWQST